MHANEAVMDLFAKFIDFRQRGTNRDDAWYRVLDIAEADGFSEKQVKRLLILAKNWETREGHKYHVRTRARAHETIIASANRPATESVIRPIEPPPHKPTMILDPSVLEALEQTSSSVSTGKLADVHSVEQRQREASYFGDNSLILFCVQGTDDVIRLQVPGDVEKIIGRSTPNAAMSPDVDLAVYDQGQYGISRMHAVLLRHDDTLMIQDIGSANHTYLNDERLFPHELRMLKDGDVLSIARLLMQVRFLHS